MAGLIEFGLTKPELAGSFAGGYAGAEKARLQNAATQLETEAGRYKLDELKRDRDAMIQLQDRLKSMGQDPDLDKVFDALIATGKPDYVTQGLEGKKRLNAQREYAKAQGLEMPGAAPVVPNALAPAAPAAPTFAPAPQNELGSGMFGMPTPAAPAAAPAQANALAPAPAAAPAPANALAAAPEAAQATQVRNQMTRLMSFAAQFPGTPEAAQAMQQARILQDQLELYSRKPAATPAAMQEWEQYQRMDPEQRKLYQEFKKSGAAQGTTVHLPPQQNAFEAELGKKQADRITSSQAAANDAVGIIDTVKRGRDILRSGAITGAGADFLVGFNQALKTMGIDFGYADAAANSQAFAANMASNVGKLIKQFGAGTGLSNADREYAEKMAGGKISLDRSAIDRILDINERAARNVIRKHNKDVSGIKTNIPLTVEEPAQERKWEVVR